MKRMRITVVACAVVVAASLLLARVHPFGDAGLYAADGVKARALGLLSVPPEVRSTLVEKCGDCHSAQTHTPLYGRFAPVSWLLERDVVEGRRAMDLSLWDSYSGDQRQVLMAKILQETKVHAMPLPQYRLIHWNARITDADLNAFARWARNSSAVAPGSPMEFGGAGDATRGKEIFEKRCTGCHALNQNREGPLLHGVYGRTSGEIAGFPYSAALKKAHLVWNDSTLEQWLTDPDSLVPGNDMSFHVARPQERMDLISYLRREAGK